MAGWLICGVDDRDEARALCVFATHLARRLGLRPMVVHVTQVAPTFPYGNHEITERQRRAARERGRQALSRALAGCALPEDAVADRVEIGEPAARLVELADEHEASLIVVGSRGRGALKGALLGSVSERVGVRSSRPVVVVPPRAVKPAPLLPPRFGTVICGLDLFEDSGVADYAARLAALVGARLVLAHASARAIAPISIVTSPEVHRAQVESDDEAGEELLRSVAARLEHRVDVTTRLAWGHAPEVLDALAEEESADLIVVGNRGHGSISSTILGSVLKTLTMSASRPVVLAPLASTTARARDDRRPAGTDSRQPRDTATLPSRESLGRLGGVEGRR